MFINFFSLLPTICYFLFFFFHNIGVYIIKYIVILTTKQYYIYFHSDINNQTIITRLQYAYTFVRVEFMSSLFFIKMNSKIYKINKTNQDFFSRYHV